MSASLESPCSHFTAMLGTTLSILAASETEGPMLFVVSS